MSAHYFEIHVFGGRADGEGIVLKFPDGRYGVVDSCTARTADGDVSYPLIEFLKDRVVKQLAFVCLTHPHADHFKGLNSLFEQFEVAQYWHPSAITAEQLKRIVKMTKIPAHEINAFSDLHDADELQQLYKQLANMVKQARLRRPRLGFSVVQVEMNLGCYQPQGQNFRILAVAPHGNDVFSFNQQLADAFDDQGRLTKDVTRQAYNQISMALLIIMPNFRVLLGGDVENSSWKQILSSCSESDWQSALYKVSHHGSAGAFCNELRTAVYIAGRQTVSVLTGYSKSGLPSGEMIETLRQHSSHVAITHRNHLRASTMAAGNLASRQALANHFSIPVEDASARQSRVLQAFGAVPADDPSGIGICSFHFDKDGHVVEQTMSSAAQLA